MGRNLLAIRHLQKNEIEELLDKGAAYKKAVTGRHKIPPFDHYVVGMLFFEGSTRTRVSFEQATHFLGMKSVNFASAGSSMTKGETLKDTILTLRYERLDGLVIRHRLSGTPALAARHFGGPVLNAGDGMHEHPTQALGDAMTILERKGHIEGLTVAIVGDVDHSRVARSNAWLLHKMGAEVRFVGPRTLMPSHTSLLPGTAYYDLENGVADADVIICLRLQRERMDEGLISSIGEYAKLYQVNQDTLRYAKNDCLVMHPGPLNRGIEVDDMAADFERSAIVDQVTNGIFVRMAALDWVFTSTAPAKPAPAAKPKPRSRPAPRVRAKAKA